MAHGSATLVGSWRFSPEWLFPRLQKLRHTALSEERPEVGFGGRVASREGGGFRREREKGQLAQASRQDAPTQPAKNIETCKHPLTPTLHKPTCWPLIFIIIDRQLSCHCSEGEQTDVTT